MESGILGLGIKDSALGIRNSSSTNKESKIQKLTAAIRRSFFPFRFSPFPVRRHYPRKKEYLIAGSGIRNPPRIFENHCIQSSLRGRRKKGRGRGRGEGEREKGREQSNPIPNPPPRFPFLPIPYPLPLSTPATQATCNPESKTVKDYIARGRHFIENNYFLEITYFLFSLPWGRP